MNRQPQGLRLDVVHAMRNLAVLAVLGGVIAFACILVVDQISRAAGGMTSAVSDVAVMAVLVAVAGLICGIIYIPVVGSVNEKLFGSAIASLLFATVVYKLAQDGLDWSLLSVGTALLCFGVLATITPSRIKAAYTTQPKASRKRDAEGAVGSTLSDAVISTPRQQRQPQTRQQAQYRQPPETSEFPIQQDERYGI